MSRPKKTARNEGLVRLHKDFPQLSYASLGKPYGISKQRVGRILRDTPKNPHQTTQNRFVAWLKRSLDRLLEMLD